MKPRVSLPAAPASLRKHGVRAARRMGSEPHREGTGIEDLLADGVGQADFGGGDEPVVARAEAVLREFRQLSGAEQRVVSNEHGRVAFGIAALAHLVVEHELRDGAVEAGHTAAQESESRAAHLRGGLELHAQRRAEIGVFARGEVELRQVAPACLLDIVRLVRALGHIVCRDIGKAGELCLQFFAQ